MYSDRFFSKQVWCGTVPSLLDWLFPRICVGCGCEQTWLCDQCLSTVEAQSLSSHRLALNQDGQAVSTHLDALIALGPYSNPVLREAIHGLKYGNLRTLAESLGQLLRRRLDRLLPDWSEVVVTAIPLHKDRQHQRDYNQAALIGQAVAPDGYRETLVRYQKRPAQATLGRKERIVNAKGIFALRPQAVEIVRDKIVVLVDDVTTTGSTLQEAAEILRQAQPKAIWGAVIAQEE